MSQRQHAETSDARATTGTPGQGEQGQVLVLFALMLFVLVGFVALAVDAGYLMAERRQAQAKADGAAMAADKAYQRNQISDIVSTGIDYATAGDDSIDPGEVTVTPLATHTVNGITYQRCVEVVIEHDVTPFFVGAIYSGTWAVSAEAVACTEPQGRDYALYALDEDGDGIRSSGTADVTITNGGGAMSNATDDPSISLCGSVNWDQGTGVLDAVNGINLCNNANVVTGTPNPTAPSVADPLAAVTEPSCTGMTSFTNRNVPAAQRYNGSNASTFIPDIDLGGGPNDPVGAVQAFRPGNYPDGISISTKAFTVIFLPGLYCIGQQGSVTGLDISKGAGGGSMNVTGTGVLLYFYEDASLNIDGQGVNANFSYPVACGLGGSYADACARNIVVFYSRSNCERLVLNGNVVTMTGVFYAPCSRIQLEGNGDLSITGVIISGEIAVRGGNQVTIEYMTGVTANPPQVYLVE